MNGEPAIAALRAEQLLARAERSPVADDELDDRLDELRQQVDETELRDAVDAARAETADELLDDA